MVDFKATKSARLATRWTKESARTLLGMLCVALPFARSELRARGPVEHGRGHVTASPFARPPLAQTPEKHFACATAADVLAGGRRAWVCATAHRVDVVKETHVDERQKAGRGPKKMANDL